MVRIIKQKPPQTDLTDLFPSKVSWGSFAKISKLLTNLLHFSNSLTVGPEGKEFYWLTY